MNQYHSGNYYYVEFWSRNSELRPIVEGEMLPIESCTKMNLARLAAERGSLFVVCPQKFGCKQIQPNV